MMIVIFHKLCFSELQSRSIKSIFFILIYQLKLNAESDKISSQNSLKLIAQYSSQNCFIYCYFIVVVDEVW